MGAFIFADAFDTSGTSGRLDHLANRAIRISDAGNAISMAKAIGSSQSDMISAPELGGKRHHPIIAWMRISLGRDGIDNRAAPKSGMLCGQIIGDPARGRIIWQAAMAIFFVRAIAIKGGEFLGIRYRLGDQQIFGMDFGGIWHCAIPFESSIFPR